MADAQIAIIDGDPTQIAVIEGDQTQIVMAPGENPAIVTAIPGPQGPAGAVAAAIDGSAALPSIAFASDTDTGLYRVGANQLGVSTGGTQRLVIDASGQIEATSLGSAASPTWTFVGDPNTGIYSPGADQLALSTNGTGRLFIDASGNVGIGTTTSLNAFTLSRADNTGAIELRIDNTGSSYQSSLRFTGKDAGGLYPVVALIQGYQATNADSGELRFSTKPTGGSATERLRITSAGLVGVGTSAPSSILHCANAGTLQATIQNTAASLTTFLSGGSSAGGVGTSTNHPFDFFTNNQFRARIDSSGRVGIGTTSPNASIIQTNQSTATIAAGINLYNSSGVSGGIVALAAAGSGGGSDALYLQGSSNIQIVTGATERARIDSSGRLLVGTSSARANFFNAGVTSPVQVESTTDAVYSATRNSNNAFGPGIILAKSRGTSVGSNTVVQSGDLTGGIYFQGSDGTEFVETASITSAVDGTPGANDMPGRLVFSTTADGAASPTERMRLDRDGTLLLGVTTKVIGQTTNPYLFFQAQSNVTTAGMSIESYGNNTALRYHFAFTNPNGVVGTISTNGTATAYNTSSDYRLKENVTPVTDGITRLQQLKPSRFNFIADPTKTVDGFIAHEVQTIVPEAITGEKDAVDDQGNPVYQGIDQSKLVPLLTAALQEAIGEIESLKARVAALESA